MPSRSRRIRLTILIAAALLAGAGRAVAQRPAAPRGPAAGATNTIAYAPWAPRQYRLRVTGTTTWTSPDTAGTLEQPDSAAVLLTIGAVQRGDSLELQVAIDRILFTVGSLMPSDTARQLITLARSGWPAATVLTSPSSPFRDRIVAMLQRLLTRLPEGPVTADRTWRDSTSIRRTDMQTLEQHRSALRAVGWEQVAGERALRIAATDSFSLTTPEAKAGVSGSMTGSGVARIDVLAGESGAPVRGSAETEIEIRGSFGQRRIVIRGTQRMILERAVTVGAARSAPPAPAPATAAPAFRPDASTGEALCRSDEQVIFAAAIERSTKLVALCGSMPLDRDSGYLVYRYGNPDDIELIYPTALQTSRAAFRYIRYTRPQVTYNTIRFENHGFLYSIHEVDNGEESPPSHSAYVTVTRMSDHRKVAELRCVMPVRGTLMRLETVVPNRQWTEEDALEP